ncbi:hypothetical protein N7520_005209 [Penicillium odoratum]|uniref:uncharacterized protein n=1 Tax=Penicillium odoratum TaxID=1167516 RepID=UPI002548005B|nr:uncharacterized protein N7520_005209 [Penicillium odoratum]KAJ5765650.1 hypothetical protein N7520_005209 [Penicillium odoratum]
MSFKSKVTLIPWDPDSTAHRHVLLRQRQECTWHQEKVEKEWREAQLKGSKCIHWIRQVFPDDSHITEHMSSYLRSKKTEVLRDTAQFINAAHRKPSQRAFIPIGHISLDSMSPESTHLNLDIPRAGVFWIKSFYVSRALQGQGIGRVAMDEVEKMAIRDPLNAQTLMLDSIQRDDSLREEFALATQGCLPKVVSEDWYTRRGYRVIRTVHNYYIIEDRKGKIWDTKTVFMRKDI